MSWWNWYRHCFIFPSLMFYCNYCCHKCRCCDNSIWMYIACYLHFLVSSHISLFILYKWYLDLCWSYSDLCSWLKFLFANYVIQYAACHTCIYVSIKNVQSRKSSNPFIAVKMFWNHGCSRKICFGFFLEDTYYFVYF